MPNQSPTISSTVFYGELCAANLLKRYLIANGVEIPEDVLNGLNDLAGKFLSVSPSMAPCDFGHCAQVELEKHLVALLKRSNGLTLDDFRPAAVEYTARASRRIRWYLGCSTLLFLMLCVMVLYWQLFCEEPSYRQAKAIISVAAWSFALGGIGAVSNLFLHMVKVDAQSALTITISKSLVSRVIGKHNDASNTQCFTACSGEGGVGILIDQSASNRYTSSTATRTSPLPRSPNCHRVATRCVPGNDPFVFGPSSPLATTCNCLHRSCKITHTCFQVRARGADVSSGIVDRFPDCPNSTWSDTSH